MSELPTDQSRKSEHMWQYATVTAVDCDRRPPAVKVELDEGQESDWIPFGSLRSGSAYVWMPPANGELGIVLSAGGEMQTLHYISSTFKDAYVPDNASETLTEVGFPNGDKISHDDGDMVVDVTGDYSITCGGTYSVSAQKITADCTIETSDDVVASGVSLVNHSHSDVKKGPDKTGKPARS